VGSVERPLVDQLPCGAVRHSRSVGEELVNGSLDVGAGEEVDHVQLVPVRVRRAAVLTCLTTRPTDTASSNMFHHCARLADLGLTVERKWRGCIADDWFDWLVVSTLLWS
jgi:hypothetical protein